MLWHLQHGLELPCYVYFLFAFDVDFIYYVIIFFFFFLVHFFSQDQRDKYSSGCFFCLLFQMQEKLRHLQTKLVGEEEENNMLKAMLKKTLEENSQESDSDAIIRAKLTQV